MTDEQPATDRSDDRALAESGRSRAIKPGHLEVGEFTSGHIGASAPFGRSDFPLPVKDLYYEHPPTGGERVLDDERE